MNTQPELILAPIRGLTNLHFRNAFAQHIGGIDRALAPYLVCRPASILEKKDLWDIDLKNNLMPSEVQLLGKESHAILSFLTQLKNLGHTQANLNLGCPYPMVTHKGMGSALLSTPETTIPLLSDLLEKSPINLSLKLRLGLADPDEINPFIPILNQTQWSEITIHPRVGAQLYSGEVNLQSFEKVMQRMQRAVTYNGDIKFCRDYHRLKNSFPLITQWMIGRGLLMNLFLGHEIKGIDITDDAKKVMLIKFISSLEQSYLNLPNGKSHFIHRMLDLWQYYALHFASPEKAYKLVKKAKSISDYQNAREEIHQWPLSTDGKVDIIHYPKNLC